VLKALEDEFSLSKPIAEQFLPDTYGVDGIDKAIPRGIKLADRIYLNQSYEFVWPDLNAPFVGDTGYCHGLKDQIAILSDGTVVPCCLDGEGIIALGNIHETSLTDILSNKRAESFKKGFANRTVIEQLCKHCGYRERFGN
jgi:radical SAM protein with 4Fe4S-binding SPASM domain